MRMTKEQQKARRKEIQGARERLRTAREVVDAANALRMERYAEFYDESGRCVAPLDAEQESREKAYFTASSRWLCASNGLAGSLSRDFCRGYPCG